MTKEQIVAVGYARVSTSEQADSGLSIEYQKRKIRAQAEVSDLHLSEILIDAGHTAKHLRRPAMTELLARVASGQVDVIIIAKLDRLTRSIADLAQLLETLAKAKRSDGEKGVDLISSAESLDTSTATGRLVINIMASVSQWEREVIAERTSAALQELRAQGKTTGNPPYGYTAKETGELVENPEEQATLAAIAQQRAEGKAWQAVSDHLNKAGHRTRTGRAWTRQGLHHIAKRAGLT